MNGGERFALARMSRGWAAATYACFAVGIASAVFLWATSPAEMAWFPPSLTAFIVAVFLFVWGYYRPDRFELTEGGVSIVFPFRRREFPLDSIASVRMIPKDEMGFGIRLVGAGGLWGVFGLCWSKGLGKFDAYVCRSDAMVLVAFQGRRPLLITPERPEEFIAALESRIPAPGGA